MSPAARKLATTKLGLSIRTDSLRSTYSPSPLSRLKSPATPRFGVTTPKLNLGIKRNTDVNVNTDDLLKIQVPKRQKAADFF